MVVPSKPDTTEKTDLLQALKAVGVALSAAGSFEVAAKTFLRESGALSLLIPILSALGLLVACGYIIVARKAVPGSRRTHYTVAKFPLAVRVIGAIGSVALLILLGARIWNARPNLISGRSYAAGFLCDAASGAPIDVGEVVVLSRSGQPMSRAQRVDSRGFFYSELDRWSFLPDSLRVYGGACSPTEPIAIDSSSAGLCPATHDAAPNPSVKSGEWRLKCNSHH